MSDVQHTLLLVCLAAAMLGAALFGPGLGSPDPAVMLAIMVGSMMAGIAGLAFSAICGAVLLHLLADPLRMIQLLTVCSMANQVLTVWSLRRDIVWRDLGSYVAGGIAGVGPGLWTLLHLPSRHLAPVIGTILLAYAGHLFLGGGKTLPIRSCRADAAVGFAAALTGTVTTLPSLPVTIWCQLRGLNKDRMRATVQPFVLAMQVVTLPLLMSAAPESAIGAADLLCLPASLLGTQIGLGCVRGLSDRQFAIAVACLLCLCGVSFWL